MVYDRVKHFLNPTSPEPSVECYGAEHMDHLYLAIIGICVYVVGIPAAITYSLMVWIWELFALFLSLLVIVLTS